MHLLQFSLNRFEIIQDFFCRITDCFFFVIKIEPIFVYGNGIMNGNWLMYFLSQFSFHSIL